MPLFRRRQAEPVPVPSVDPRSRHAAEAVARGWEPLPTPFDRSLTDRIHVASRVLLGATPRQTGVGPAEHTTVFHDAYRTHVDERTVVVANGWTNAHVRLWGDRPEDVEGTSVCMVELPTVLSLFGLEPRSLHPVSRLAETLTGDADFDARFRVWEAAGLGGSVLVEDVRRRIAARDDWLFLGDEYRFVCVARDAFESVTEMQRRIDEVLAIVAAFPATLVAARVDHAHDDLVARIDRLESIDDALALLRDLSPADREELARSGSPLAPFADVRTPEAAMARFEALDEPSRLAVLALFQRVRDDRGG
jgi:hypothetical protein